MMRAFRAQTKWVFWILTISFVGWLALAQVTDILGPSQNVVLKIDGHEIQTPEYQRALSQAQEAYRAETGHVPETREDLRELEDRVIDQLVQSALLHDEYQRLGISASDDEVIAAARSAPPPEFMQQPQFQTDGQPDVSKWQAFLATTTDRDFLTWLDARYRQQIPQIKLGQYLTADVYVSDAKLWRVYQDQHGSVRVTVLAVRPEQIPDDQVSVSDDELRAYFRNHQDAFRRPAVAYLTYTALDRRPHAADTAAALVRAAEVRARIAGEGAEAFADEARAISGDSATAMQGGDLGWIRRSDKTYDPAFLAALARLRPGQLSGPVRTPYGVHLIQPAAAAGDSVRVSHILVPFELAGDHLEAVEARADSLDRMTADVPDPNALNDAAATLGLPLAQARLVDGERLTLGRSVIPDVSVWAFETRVGETSPVIDGAAAYYVFRLDSLIPEGVPPFETVRDAVAQRVRFDKKKTAAGARAAELTDRVRRASSLAAAGAALGLPVQTYGPFTRLAPPAALAGEPSVLGRVFGLDVGETAGPFAGERASYFLEVLSRHPADSSAWVAQRAEQRDQMLAPARQARLGAYMSRLRSKAKIVDRRRELAQQQPATSVPPIF
jgi:peptidyl-prolyl cis-trans isomerase D